ncbi:immunoglobulin E-set [Jimgerdemannia flammicorona]|uniref:Rho GDP-dissociation inhibitor n=1 Tax=Jimgerdemannia flammicorona TaxID=994334 RepID=A0A433QA39_9FUNG|nr:immunoglobulin E-set [Jimgerdemannia flammicorona]
MTNQQYNDDELAPSQTTKKKSIQEYQTLDTNNESLQKWKASLSLSQSSGPFDDPHHVIISQIALKVAGHSDIILDLSMPETLQTVKDKPFTIKEGVEYRMKVLFKIQHDVVSSLKYLQVVKRHGIQVDKTEEMIGSYGSAPEPYEKKFIIEEMPAGMLAHGHYEAKSKFVDDNNVMHIEWNWSFDIKKDWK